MSADFPYKSFESHPAWKIIEQALAELDDNDDLELRTAKRYVIGHIISALAKSGVLPAPTCEEFEVFLRFPVVKPVSSREQKQGTPFDRMRKGKSAVAWQWVEVAGPEGARYLVPSVRVKASGRHNTTVPPSAPINRR